eukprot:COSAG06_NODE_1241_length_10121_cov_45.270206_5_plen_272_part_00
MTAGAATRGGVSLLRLRLRRKTIYSWAFARHGTRRCGGSATFLPVTSILCRLVWRLEGCGDLLRRSFSVSAWLWPAAIGTSTCAIINRMISIHYLTGLVQIAYSSGLSAPPAKESRPQLPDAAHARRGAVPLPPSNPPGHARANPGPSQTLAALPIELAVLRRHQSAPRSRPHPAVLPTSHLPPRVGDKQSGCLLRTPSARWSIHARPQQQSPIGRLSRGTWQRPAAVLARYLSLDSHGVGMSYCRYRNASVAPHVRCEDEIARLLRACLC